MILKKKVSLLTIVLTLLVTFAMFSQDYGGYEPDNSPNLPAYDNDLLWERTFDDGTCYPWHTCIDTEGVMEFDVPEIAPGNKAFRAKIINAGENKWSCQMRHRGLTIEQGHTYKIKFTIWSNVSCSFYTKIGQMGDPYNEYWNNNWNSFSLTANQKMVVEDTFTMSSATDATCEFAFHAGGPLAGATPYYIYIDDISLSDTSFTKEIPVILDKPDVRVNQVGYFPQGNKKATVVNSSTSPIKWQLLNAAGTVVSEGKTTVAGLDKDSQDYVHKIDFSDFTTAGVGYTFKLPGVNSKTNYSHAFDIRDDLYSEMKLDALSYFYHNRSGIEIKMPYAGREDLCRPAGHIDVAPNTGDGAVPTTDDQPAYTLDLIGGWYDAGDHGKYVVNGGISVWTLMNQYERAVVKGVADQAPFTDGSMNIPEQNNGYPDIMDEARWQTDFMLKMQVPASKNAEYAGMAHHKIGDVTWTAIGVPPHKDPKDRYIKPVSTAATLNLAATAAQAARIWKKLGDTAYADKLLTAAEKAWTAALAHPEIYAPADATGTGPYNDNYVVDDFYWAACELYITTGKQEYETFIKASKHYLEMPHKMEGSNEDDGLWGALTWGTTQGLGTISLSLLANGLPEADIQKAKVNMAAACDKFLANIDDQGYGLPIKQADTKESGYPWGSNSFILNIMMVMGYVYDYTGDAKYLSGMTESFDYILGRNALDQSYVSGYGERPLKNPHHRFWCPSLSDDFPAPPAGCISGGPNSRFQDPTILAACPSDTPVQKVFFDHVDSWSTNEITINWNAPFAWVCSYLDEASAGPKVAITSPESGAKFEVGDDVTIKAAVSGASSVTKVEFYNGTGLLGSDKTAPYSYTMDNPEAGSYSVVAKAYLGDGEIIESPAVSFAVKVIVKPTITLTAPVEGYTCHARELVTMSADAVDSDGSVVKVEFMVDGKLVYADTEAPFEYNWKSVEGTYKITAVAYDDDGAKSDVSNSVNIVVKPGKDIEVQYLCENTQNSNTEIKGKINLVNVGEEAINLKDYTVRYYFTSESSSTLQFSCYYAEIGAGNVKGTFVGSGDDLYLEFSFGSAAIAAGSKSGQIQFVIRANDNKSFNQTNDYSFDASMTSFASHEKITLYKGSELLWGTPPNQDTLEVTLTSPLDGATYLEGDDIIVSASVNTNIDGFTPTVVFYNGSAKLGEDSKAPYSITISNADAGEYTFYASVTGPDETVKSSTSTVTVAGPTLAVSITAPADGATVDPESDVTVTASVTTNLSDATVKFYDGDTLIATDSTAPYSATIDSITAGEHRISVIAAAGTLTAEDSVTITAKLVEKLEISITSPANGAGFTPDDAITVTADVTANVDIDGVSFYLNGKLLGTDNSAPYSYAVGKLAEGDYTIKAVATGSTLTDSDSVSITVKEESAGGLEVSWETKNQWNSGFQGEVTITNNSDVTVNGWEVKVSFAAGHDISNHWNANLSGSTFSNLSWNGTIAPGSSVSFGFQGNHPGTFVVPELTVTGK